jgi:hypothetical protein
VEWGRTQVWQTPEECNGKGHVNPRKSSKAESPTPQHKANCTPQPTTHGRPEGRRKPESNLEAKWPSYKINQWVWHYIDAKRETNWNFGPSWKKAIIVGIPSTATYRIRREVGNKKVKTVNIQKLKPIHCGDGDRPREEDKGEPGQDTKGRRIEEESKTEDVDVSEEEENKTQTQEEQPQQDKQLQDKAEEEEEIEEEQDTESEHAERETTESEDEEDEKNKKRYNLRKRIGRTVYVSASKIFRLDNLNEWMKQWKEVTK